MADLSDDDIDAALARGTSAARTQPRASTVRYDRQHGHIVIELTNGCIFAFPPRLAEGLDSATDEQLASVEILGDGYGLHWNTPEMDLSLPGLLSGIFGTRAHMARRAGQTTSPAKAAAARANGAKGGRPPKLATA